MNTGTEASMEQDKPTSYQDEIDHHANVSRGSKRDDDFIVNNERTEENKDNNNVRLPRNTKEETKKNEKKEERNKKILEVRSTEETKSTEGSLDIRHTEETKSTEGSLDIRHTEETKSTEGSLDIRHSEEASDINPDGVFSRRNIVSRMENYKDVDSNGSIKLVLDSEVVTVHKTEPVDDASYNEQVVLAETPKPTIDSTKVREPSRHSNRPLNTIDSTIYVEEAGVYDTEESVCELYNSETWQQAKARQTRRRAIFCTDMYANIGEMVREEGMQRLTRVSKDKHVKHSTLKRQLSELVSSKPPKSETKANDDEMEHIAHQRTMFSTDMQVNADEAESEEGLDRNDKDKQSHLERKLSELVISRPPGSTTDVSKDNRYAETRVNNVQSELVQDILMGNNTGCENETEHEVSVRPRKLTMKDVYKEIQLMRQVAAACVRPDSHYSAEQQTPEDNDTVIESAENESTNDTTKESLDEAKESEKESDDSIIEIVKQENDEQTNTDGSSIEDKDIQTTEENPTHWFSEYADATKTVVKVDNYKGEPAVGCVVYNDQPGRVSCAIIGLAEVPSVVSVNEILVSNIVMVKPGNNIDDDKAETVIGIPFVKQEIQYFQEVNLRILGSNDQWQEWESNESGIKEKNMDIPLMVMKIDKPTICAVVARQIVDHITFTKTLTKFYSTVDNEIFLTCPVSARINKKDVHVELKVMPIPPEVLEEVKESYDTDRQKLYNAGAIVTIDFLDDTPQTVFTHVPCPRPAAPSRPMTGNLSSRLSTPDSGYRSASRPSICRKGSFGRYVEPSNEKESHLIRFASCMATKVKRLTSDDVTLDDLAIFSVHEKSSTSIVLEVTEGQKPNVIEKVVPQLLNAIEHQTVQVCLAHSKTSLNELALSCARGTDVDNSHMAQLEAKNTVTVRPLSLREGDTMCLCFRGNIASISKHQTIFRYYGIHGIHTAWTIDIVDRFSQRSLSSFCGFLQLCIWKAIRPFTLDARNVDDRTLWNIALEIPISLPKSTPKLSTKLLRVPITVRTEGPITPELLENLAKCIGDEWPRLAKALRIDHARIQSIKQQHRGRSQELARDILITWFKRSLFVKEKSATLIMALRHIGREDLAETLKENSKQYRRERYKIARDNRMETVITSVCKSDQVICKWKDIASILGLSDSDIHVIDSDNADDSTKCRKMLCLWKKRQVGHSIRKLLKCLRHLGLHIIADHLLSIMTTKAL